MRHLLAIPAAMLATLAMNASAATVDLSALSLAGSAQMAGSDLQLTSTGWQAGAGWVQNAISTTSSFSTTFSFSLQGAGFNGSMADGIALVFQNKGNNVVGNGGHDVGYWSLDGVGSIIQTWDNNHVGLSTDGTVDHVQAAPGSWNLGATRSVTGTETVSYDAATHVLSMTGTFLDGSAGGTSHVITDSKVVDLSAKFGSTMYLGFTGGTGGSYADQRITSFEVSAVPEPDTYAMLAAGLGLLGFAARRKAAKKAAK
jgi:hypothetical protein